MFLLEKLVFFKKNTKCGMGRARRSPNVSKARWGGARRMFGFVRICSDYVRIMFGLCSDLFGFVRIMF
jgi:hypothetical protein